MPTSLHTAIKAHPNLLSLHYRTNYQDGLVDDPNYQLYSFPQEDESGKGNWLHPRIYNTTFSHPYPLAGYAFYPQLNPLPTLPTGIGSEVFIAAHYVGVSDPKGTQSVYYEIATMALKATELTNWSVEFAHAAFNSASAHFNNVLSGAKNVVGRPSTVARTDDQFVIAFAPSPLNANKWCLIVTMGNDADGAGVLLEWTSADWTPDNAFHHYCVTCDGTTIRVYRDGVALAVTLTTNQQQSINVTPIDVSERIRQCVQPNAPINWLGTVQSKNSPMFPLQATDLEHNVGFLSTLAVYDAALTSTVVKAHFDLLNVA